VTAQEIKVERTSEAQAHKRKNGPSFFKQKKQLFFKKKKNVSSKFARKYF
jgi:hypothetical protein